MSVQTPQLPPTPGEVIEAGVIDDARARQRRHRRIGILLIAMTALAAGLTLGFSGGGGGSRAGRHDGGDGANAAAPGHSLERAPASAPISVPPNIGAFGLLAPRVGWAANGLGLFITRDGGRSWRTVKVPNLQGDVIANLLAAASPEPDTVILSFADGAYPYDRTCPHPTTPAVGQGALAVSTDSGRTWRSYRPPGCQFVAPLSFISRDTGFTLLSEHSHGSVLYRTQDGARSWQRVGAIPFSVEGFLFPFSIEGSVSPISFASAADGWAVHVTGAASTGRGTLYRTTDGGRTWTRSDVCPGPANQGVTFTCQTPRFSGTNGVMLALTADSATGTDRLLVYTTRDAGDTWSTHTVTADQALRSYIARGQPIPFSAPNPHDLFVFLAGTLYRSVDGGSNWSQLPEAGLSGNVSLDFVSADYGWIQAGGHFDYTTDGGEHWKAVGGR